MYNRFVSLDWITGVVAGLAFELVIEVEKKLIAPCDLLVELRKKLPRFGFRLEWRGGEEDIYYNHPCRDFASTDEALRIRVSSGKVELTYKGPKKRRDLKVRDEFTVQIHDNVISTVSILERLGFRALARFRKEREVYRGGPRGSVGVFLDKVECLGCFIEIEVLSPGEDYSYAISIVDYFINELGLSWLDSTVKSYLELVLEKGGC